MNPLRSARTRLAVDGLADGALVTLLRGARAQQRLRMGPNEVHAGIIHPDGSWTDLGISRNLLTNVGRDLAAAALGHAAMKGGAMTASSATSATPAGGGMTVDAYKGWRVICPVTGLTTAPVYGNVGSNSATVLTIDQWWTEADAVGTTPAATNGYIVKPVFTPRFIALTADASAANAASTALTGELTTNGLARALGTYAHTGGTATLTLTKSFSVTGTQAGIHRAGLLTASTLTAAGVICFETVLNADASVVNGDTLQVTWTITLS